MQPCELTKFIEAGLRDFITRLADLKLAKIEEHLMNLAGRLTAIEDQIRAVRQPQPLSVSLPAGREPPVAPARRDRRAFP